MKPLSTLLVANRGEIALRVMRTARRMGLATVAVYSDADARAPHVRFADQAVRLGPAPSHQSYLDVAAVLRAAALTRADAVHPGYGFLSERPDFAEAVLSAGLTFIGPTPASIRAMGLKREAKALVGRRGVPLVPGFDGGDQSTPVLRARALELGLPVLFKPSAGGGGKGMRLVRQAQELEAAIESGRREASSSFGDPTLIIEKYLERPRHVEVQVLGDLHGHLVHLFERECSIQRRHQKLIEESPSPALDDGLRTRMGEAALEVARAVSYVGAGTVEFILDRAGAFFFSEMNTRLQVEHRVTEQVLGLDLVEWQLRIARGEPLAFRQEDLRPRGHALECRVYAEDPARDFLPAPGTLYDWHTPELGGLLVDSGVESGGEVPVDYDPLLAKLVTWGEDRADAVARMRRALGGVSALGVTTNLQLLQALLAHPKFQLGQLHTGFIEAELHDALAQPPAPEAVRTAAVAATLFAAEQRRRQDPYLPQVPPGWRNNRVRDQQVSYGATEVEYRWVGPARYLVRSGGVEGEYEVAEWAPPRLVLVSPSGLRQPWRVVEGGGRWWVHGPSGSVALAETPRYPAPSDAAVQGGLLAPMPGKVVRVEVQAGDPVRRGQVLLVLEAMKMEQSTVSPVDGVVTAVRVRQGEQVTAGQILAVVEPAAP